MAVSFGETTVVIDGACGVEDALPLLEYLQSNTTARLDLRTCTTLHTAALQVVMAVASRVAVLPEEPFMSRWLTPLFGANVTNRSDRPHDMLVS